MAALVGPYGLTFLTLLVGLLAGLARLVPLAAAAALLAAGWGWGGQRLAEPLPPREPPVMVRLVQPNATQAEKWDPEREAQIFARLRALSQSPAPVRPDVTIWPETAVPFLLGRDPEAQLAAAASAAPGLLATGIRRVEPAGDDWLWFNSLALLAPDGAVRSVYDKSRLVPGGEYLPLEGLVARLGLSAQA